MPYLDVSPPLSAVRELSVLTPDLELLTDTNWTFTGGGGIEARLPNTFRAKLKSLRATGPDETLVRVDAWEHKWEASFSPEFAQLLNHVWRLGEGNAADPLGLSRIEQGIEWTAQVWGTAEPRTTRRS